MNKKVLTAATIAVLSCFVSTAWAERPDVEKPVCTFQGGAYYESNNTLYLESLSDENASVEIAEKSKNCIDGFTKGEFNLVVERSTKLAANSTISLPMNYSPKNSCIKLYEVVQFSTDDNGNWNATAKNVKDKGDMHKPTLMITDVENKACQDIKEIEFTANNLQAITQHTAAQQHLEVYNPKTGHNDWSLEATYKYIRWGKDDAELGFVYGYAAKNKDQNQVKAGHFVRLGTGAFVPPLRAYLKYNGTAPLAKSVESIAPELPETIDVTLIDEEEGTTRTARWNMATGEIVKVNGWYDLKGRKLNSKPQNKGMFIGNTKVQK